MNAANQLRNGDLAISLFLAAEKVEQFCGQNRGVGDPRAGFRLEALLLVGVEPAIEAPFGNLPQPPAPIAVGLLDYFEDGLGQTDPGQDACLHGGDSLGSGTRPAARAEAVSIGLSRGAFLRRPHGNQPGGAPERLDFVDCQGGGRMAGAEEQGSPQSGAELWA